MKILEPKSKEDIELYYDIRWRILRKPWNQPRGSEKDDKEETSIHIMAFREDGIPVGTGRAHFNSAEEAQIRYMAVEENQRGNGTGGLILKELEKRAKEKGAKYVILNARDSAVSFYEKHGYKLIQKSHTLFNTIPHFLMKKNI